MTEHRWIPGLNAGCRNRGGSWSWRAAQTLGAPGWSAPIWAAAIIGLAAVESRGGAMRVMDRVRLGRIACLWPVGCKQKHMKGEFTHMQTRLHRSQHKQQRRSHVGLQIKKYRLSLCLRPHGDLCLWNNKVLENIKTMEHELWSAIRCSNLTGNKHTQRQTENSWPMGRHMMLKMPETPQPELAHFSASEIF